MTGRSFSRIFLSFGEEYDKNHQTVPELPMELASGTQVDSCILLLTAEQGFVVFQQSSVDKDDSMESSIVRRSEHIQKRKANYENSCTQLWKFFFEIPVV